MHRSHVLVAGVALALLLVGSTPGLAADGPALMVKLGSTGAGVDLCLPAGDGLAVRLGIAAASITINRTSGDVDYRYDAKPLVGSVLLDFYPTRGVFHLTGGAIYNGIKVDGRAQLTDTKTYHIGNGTYTGSQLGHLDGTADFNTLAPYLGFGWGNPGRRSTGWGVTFDVGAFYQGSPKVTLKATNPLGLPGVDDNVKLEQQKVASDLASYKVYPVVSLAVGYRF
jgi:hypothetical protein